jgi:hypothetical protein
MQASNVESTVRGRTKTLPTTAQHWSISKAAAFENLQAAILRLATQQPIRPGNHGRQDIGALVEQALRAYREYMK